MNGSINAEGLLFIERPRPGRGIVSCVMESIQMICFHDCEEYCGDHCPLFREPQGMDNGKEARLELCHGTILFNEFKDYRLNNPDWPRR